MKHLVTYLNLVIMSTNANAQQWVDRNLYPFRNRMMGFETGNMHCVDEGKRETILFVHGTPTWSFLCRDIVKELPDWYQAQWEQLDKLANKELAYHLGNGRCVCQNGGIISMGRAAAQLRHDRAQVWSFCRGRENIRSHCVDCRHYEKMNTVEQVLICNSERIGEVTNLGAVPNLHLCHRNQKHINEGNY